MDRLSNDILKALCPSIAFLCLLFNLSFSTGKSPSAWKHAIIIPIFKNKGSLSDPVNYRPISLLSCISKVCERIFFETLYTHVQPALSPNQSGFCRGDSTVLQLCRIMQDIYSSRDKGGLLDYVSSIWPRPLTRYGTEVCFPSFFILFV